MASAWLPVASDDPRARREQGFLLGGMGLAALYWALVPLTDQVDVVGAALTTAFLVVVPLGAGMTVPLERSRGGWRLAPAVLVGPAAVAAAATPGRPLATLPAAFWIAVAVILLATVLERADWRPWRSGLLGDDALATLAHAYLVVGAVWFTIHVAGWRPLDFAPEIIELTAVHFHYAGFAALLVARAVRERSPDAPRLAATAVALVAVAPPVIAVGFSFATPLQVLGAVLLTIGLWLTSWLTLRHVVPTVPAGLPKVLLVVSSLAVLAPMVLAVQWALANLVEVPALSIPDMANVHGTTNALAFAVPALLVHGFLDRLRPEVPVSPGVGT